jgi:hypothetical protein
MQELRLVAVSEDGTYCVLAVPGRGGRFVLPIDDRLRTVARGQFSRLAQYEIEVENPLRPKEIQDRIRSGETAEEIADAAGIPIDRVRRFEGPVLAEREFRAQEAQRSTVRGHTESGPGPRLGEVVLERLADAGASADTLAWDSRKRTDGNWQVQLQFTLDHRPQLAEWVFDPRRRHVIPADDLARRLCLPQADWPAGRLGALGAPSATVTPIGSRLGAHHVEPRTEARAESDRALARGAHAAPAPAPAPAHAPWSREAREPGWARETTTTQTPTVPVPVARQPEPDRAPVPLPAAQAAGADYGTAAAPSSSPSRPAGTAAADAGEAPRPAEFQSAELRAAELRVAELRAAETGRTPAPADDGPSSGRPAAGAGQFPAASASLAAPATSAPDAAAAAQSGRHATTPPASPPAATTAPAASQQAAASDQPAAATSLTDAAAAAMAVEQASAAASAAQAAAMAGDSTRDADSAGPDSAGPASAAADAAGTAAANADSGGVGAAGAAASEAPRPAEPAEADSQPRTGRKAGRNRRASVPSWDEIMLGNSRQPD